MDDSAVDLEPTLDAELVVTGLSDAERNPSMIYEPKEDGLGDKLKTKWGEVKQWAIDLKDKVLGKEVGADDALGNVQNLPLAERADLGQDLKPYAKELDQYPGSWSSNLDAISHIISREERLKVAEFWGENLTIFDEGSIAVDHSISMLAKLPSRISIFLRESGLKIVLSDGKDDHPLGEDGKVFISADDSSVSCSKIHGEYDVDNHVAMTSHTFDETTVLHEVGHGLGMAMALHFDDRLSACYEAYVGRIIEANRVSEVCKDNRLRHEFIANSFADFFTLSKDTFGEEYSGELYDHLSKIVYDTDGYLDSLNNKQLISIGVHKTRIGHN